MLQVTLQWQMGLISCTKDSSLLELVLMLLSTVLETRKVFVESFREISTSKKLGRYKFKVAKNL